jgi:membrane fusion protein
MSDLFRREAIKYSERRFNGQVILNTPVSMRLMTLLLLLAVGLGALFLVTASYARKETVSGWLVPQGGLIQVTSSHAGVLEKIYLPEGGVVREGEPIALVRSAAFSTSGNRDGRLLRQVSEEARVKSEIDQATLRKLSDQADALRRRRAAMVTEIQGVEAQRAALVAAQALAEQQLARGQALQEKGFLSASGAETLRGNVLTAAQHVAEVTTALANARRQLVDLDSDIAEAPNDIAVARATAAQAQLELSDRKTSIEAEYSTVATAPVSGRLLTFPVKVGQPVNVGATLAIVAPGQGNLSAELYVPTRAAGFIRPGQDVRLMYAAYPFQRFGTGRGVVAAISRTALAPNQIELQGRPFSEPMFKVVVRLKEESIQAYGRAARLQPGMLLDADIVFDRRNLLQWVLEPLYAAGRRG